MRAMSQSGRKKMLLSVHLQTLPAKWGTLIECISLQTYFDLHNIKVKCSCIIIMNDLTWWQDVFQISIV